MYVCLLIVATFTANYASCNLKEFLYGKDLGRRKFNINLAITNNVDNLLKMDGASYSFLKRQEHDKGYMRSASLDKSLSILQAAVMCLEVELLTWTVRRWENGL